VQSSNNLNATKFGGLTARRSRRVCVCLLPALLAALFYLPLLQAQSTESSAAETSQARQALDAQVVRRLQAIRNALEGKREQVRGLLEEIQSADESRRDGLRRRIETLQQEIRELSDSFERTAVGGLNLRSVEAAGDEKLDWRDELVQIARPILDGLKKATARPRRIAELQASIDLYLQQLEQASKALELLARFDNQQIPADIQSGIADLTAAWRRQRDDLDQSLKIARSELQFLESEDARIFENMGGVTYDFILGRGLTLLLALFAGIALWIAMRMLRRSLSRGWRAASGNNQSAQLRLMFYAYHLLTIVLVTLAVLSVFYLRGDLLLLSLAMVALVMLALGVWRFLPGYIKEARLLLNAGTARQGERVIYNGLPYRIESLNLHSELRNPELEGRLRLPLAALAELTSRPAQDEPWYPCRPGDYLLLPNGDFAEVLRQTVELVQLRVLGSPVQYDSAAFLQLNARNLSREGFGVAVTFGIDYRHQAIALERVPPCIKAGVEANFEQAGLTAQLVNLTVEFKSAGASSLDYLVYATMHGDSAAAYFKIGRLIQRSCVATCNREGWVIPFAQLTIHRAEDAAADDDD